MEPIIRNPAVASEARQLRRPRAEPATHATQQPAREASFANRAMGPASAEERQSEEAPIKPSLSSDMRQMDEAEELEKRLADEKILADARALAEQRGYAAGLEKGEGEARKAIAEHGARLSSIVAALSRAKADAIEKSEDDIVEIVYAAVCRIIGDVAVTPEAIVGIVKQTVGLSRDRDQLTIRLHPEDFEMVQATLLQTEGAITEKPVNLVPDAAIELGGCIVEGASGSLDARLELQMGLLRRTLIDTRSSRKRNEESA